MPALTLHQRQKHPTYVDGCFGCKVSTLQFAPSVAESTESGAHVKAANEWDRLNELDVAAYKSLVANGIQPAHVGGCDRAVREGHTDYEIVSGQDLRRTYGDEIGSQMRRDLPHVIQDVPNVYEAVTTPATPMDADA